LTPFGGPLRFLGEKIQRRLCLLQGAQGVLQSQRIFNLLKYFPVIKLIP